MTHHLADQTGRKAARDCGQMGEVRRDRAISIGGRSGKRELGVPPLGRSPVASLAIDFPRALPVFHAPKMKTPLRRAAAPSQRSPAAGPLHARRFNSWKRQSRIQARKQKDTGMRKPKKTARELTEMIADEMSLVGVRLDIHAGAAGWHAVVYGSSPNRVAQAQTGVDQIAQRLRQKYDLED